MCKPLGCSREPPARNLQTCHPIKRLPFSALGRFRALSRRSRIARVPDVHMRSRSFPLSHHGTPAMVVLQARISSSR
jgi:hypothetical protein